MSRGHNPRQRFQVGELTTNWFPPFSFDVLLAGPRRNRDEIAGICRHCLPHLGVCFEERAKLEVLS